MASFFVTILDPIFSWVLLFPSIIGILILSFIVSLLITIIYKYTTNQVLMRELKSQLNKGREKIKKNKGNPQKQLEVQTDLLKVQQKYMMQSLRSTLFTMLPVLLLFGWMQAHYAYVPFEADQPITVSATFAQGVGGTALLASENAVVIENSEQEIIDSQSQWQVTASERGEYLLTFSTGQQNVTHELHVGSADIGSKTPFKNHDGLFKQTKIHYQKLVVIPVSIFGWQPGWLATYIIFSIVFSISLRKLLKLA